jgi:hypothetical protein
MKVELANEELTHVLRSRVTKSLHARVTEAVKQLNASEPGRRFKIADFVRMACELKLAYDPVKGNSVAPFDLPSSASLTSTPPTPVAPQSNPIGLGPKPSAPESEKS